MFCPCSIGFSLCLLFIIFILWHFQVLEELGLDAGDLVDEAPSFFEPSCQEHSELNSVTLYCSIKRNKI